MRVPILLMLVLFALALGLSWLVFGERGGPSRALASAPVQPVSQVLPDRADVAVPAADETLRPSLARAELSPEQDSVAIAADPVADNEDLGAANAWLRGRLIDEQGEPISGGRVWLAESYSNLAVPLEVEPAVRPGWLRCLETESDQDGRFVFQEPPSANARRVRLSARADGFRPTRLSGLSVPAAAQGKSSTGGLDVGDLILRLGASVSGRVVGPSGTGLADARLLLATDSPGAGLDLRFPGYGIPLGSTRVGGGFDLQGLAAGPFRLIVDAAGYLPQKVEGEVGADAAGSADNGDAELLIQLEPGLDIRGRVVGAEHRDGPLFVVARPAEVAEDERHYLPPLPRGTLLERARSTRVLADGAFEVSGLIAGYDYRLVVEQARGTTGTRARIKEVQSVRARAGEHGVIIELPLRSSVTFLVQNETSAPLEDFTVLFGERRPRALRDDEQQIIGHFPGGRVEFDRDQDGEGFSLTVISSTHSDLLLEGLRLVRGELLDLGTLTLEPSAGVAVRVLDRQGLPLEDALVVAGAEQPIARWIENSSWSSTQAGSRNLKFARTDAEGLAVIHPRETGVFHLTALAQDHVAAPPRAVSLAVSGSMDEQELRLEPAPTLEVTVLDQEGFPLPDEQLVLERGRRDWQLATDAQGVARFEDLRPGDYVLTLNADEPGRAPLEVELAVGEQLQVELRAPDRGRLYGRVREGGQPLADAELILFDAAGETVGWSSMKSFDFTRRSVTTDRAGRFEFQGVAAGAHELRIYHASRAMPVRLPLNFTPPSMALPVDLSLTIVSGRVVDIEGAPIEGARVVVRDPADGRRNATDLVGYELHEGETGALDFRLRRLDRSGVRTDGGGNFELRGVRGDVELFLEVSRRGYQRLRTDPLRLAAGVVRDDLELLLRPAGTIRVSVEGLNPGDPTRLIVRARRVGAPAGSRATTIYLSARRSSNRLRDLAIGRWRLQVTRWGGARGRPETPVEVVELELSAGAELEHVIDLR